MAFRPLFENEKPHGEYDAIVIAHIGEYKPLLIGLASVVGSYEEVRCMFLHVKVRALVFLLLCTPYL